jgi:nucleoside-diphosphate-sugar epimerase
MLIGVTGGSGRIGRAVVAELVGHDHEVRNVDIGRSYEVADRYRRADLREIWQTIDALGGVDAVVHLAGIGAPEGEPSAFPLLAEHASFTVNAISTYNVFTAARSLGVKRVVWASSETVAGFPFEVAPPDFLPVTEEHPIRPEYNYALAKAVGEELARNIAYNSGPSITSLRFSLVFDEQRYRDLPGYWADPARARWNLWSYVDIRDVATSCRLAAEAVRPVADSFVVAAPDTLMTRPTADLLEKFAPELLPLVRTPLSEFQSLQSTDKIAAVLGFRPEHSWREQPNLGSS